MLSIRKSYTKPTVYTYLSCRDIITTSLSSVNDNIGSDKSWKTGLENPFAQSSTSSLDEN